MARNNKTLVDYFPHYVTHGKTLLILRNEFGNDGYAFWFSILEILCKTNGQFYDYNKPADWRLLLAETHVNEEKANSILKTLVDLEAIDRELYENNVIWVQNLVDNLEGVYDRRRGGKPSKPSYCQHKPVIAGISVNNNDISADINAQTKQNKTIPNKTTSEIAKKLAELLKSLILQNNPGAKLSDNTDKWERDFDLMISRDYRTPELIESVMRFSQSDDFWKTNILSPGKLREKFDQLYMKMNSNPNGGNGNASKPNLNNW